MNKDEIGKMINPKHPWVYGPTTAPTKLIFSDGTEKVGYFQYTRQSDNLGKVNKFTFVEYGENANYFRATGDEQFVTVVDGNELINVVYPSYSERNTTVEALVRKVDSLRSALEANGLSREGLLQMLPDFHLDWGFHINDNSSREYNFGGTIMILHKGLSKAKDSFGDKVISASNNKVLLLMKDFIEGNELTVQFIKDLHRLIFESNGQFRKNEVFVQGRGSEPIKFLIASGIEDAMNVLVNWYSSHKDDKNYHPVLLASFFHHQFITIHPFDDGNGRLARIITSLILLRNKIPPPLMSLDERIYYLDAIDQTNTGDIEPWVKFICENLIKSMERLLSGN